MNKPVPDVRPANLKYVLGCKLNIAAVKIPDLTDAYVNVTNASNFPGLDKVPRDRKDFELFAAP